MSIVFYILYCTFRGLYFLSRTAFIKSIVSHIFLFYNRMMPGSKGLSPHELAHKWVKDLGTRPDMSIKVGCISHDMRIWGRIVGVRSTEQSVGIMVGGF